jgi:osmosensitive K+ channel His kinase sensor protein
VGKTYAMLADGRRRAGNGERVVVGWIDWHGRARTREQLGDLEVIAPRTVEYRGAVFTDFDAPAAIASRAEVVLVDVRQERRRRCPLRSPLPGLRPLPVLDDSCLQPLTEQAQHAPVRDRVPGELLQPAMIKTGEKVADVQDFRPSTATNLPIRLPFICCGSR